jgi:hypothetical protein
VSKLKTSQIGCDNQSRYASNKLVYGTFGFRSSRRDAFSAHCSLAANYLGLAVKRLQFLANTDVNAALQRVRAIGQVRPTQAIPQSTDVRPLTTICGRTIVWQACEMTWLAEIIVQGFWESIVHAAYRKWGLSAGTVALFGPFIIFGLLIWWVAA